MRVGNRLKKYIIYIMSLSVICSSLIYTYIYLPKSLESFDNRLRDFMFIMRGEIPQNDTTVIIDIDEKSLNEVGQWPWSRDILAQLLTNLTQAGIGVIGFDIVFPEEDRTSPHKVLKNLNIKQNKIVNYDEVFAQVIANTPTILGYQFQLDKKEFMNTKAPEIPAIFIEKNRDLEQDYLLNAKGTVVNTPIIQDNGYSSGFFNNVPDPSGIIRSVPLLIRYEEQLYPSLAFEVLRAALGINKVFVNYNEIGVESISLGDMFIPTDRFGRIIVNFRGKEKTFPYYSAVDILNNKIDPALLEGKVALIGTSAAGLFDLRATPFESVYPGVEVHANVIDNILTGDFLHKPAWIDGVNILHMVILVCFIFAVILSVNIYVIPVVFVSFLVLDTYMLYYVLFNEGIILNIFFPIVTIIVTAAVAILINYLFEIRQSNLVKLKFASKVSAKVMEDLIKNEDQTLKGESKEVTVFFSDIRGFTNISESMSDAKALIEYLNEYMEPMTEIIMKNEGTIDKFIGDAIMAYWNAPSDVKNHADKAVKASLEQLSYLKLLNERLQKENKPLVDIGIGLNTGNAVVGEMGSSGRSDYTVIGDPINLGSRLESLCKFYGSRLNISNYTKSLLQEQYVFRFLDLVKVKGKLKPVEIWQVIDFGEANGALKEELALYEEAILLYQNEKFSEALMLFEKLNVLEKKQNEKIYAIYIQRCKSYIQTPPEKFDGVYEHTTKG
ncbi:CHASE2 domain-containing protein [Candidatus Marinarcus aquaticus]|uniref:Adenylate/guanylate cyclase domain-containing protein n=1 Tax=Candidatus Marinarcus aquaticus TaxID=2044504 RepID=A0A4Q0XTC1_9BACT|nr:adenylate/guanylate cyclase domain-containing protein [Candidatus Marinarcus aquaticus]RXJ60646.1 adenylate/guanylate cyclase domain-containing protein [Candidatus Marinarcus aquaticus]